jgi:hypothetical protein
MGADGNLGQVIIVYLIGAGGLAFVPSYDGWFRIQLEGFPTRAQLHQNIEIMFPSNHGAALLTMVSCAPPRVYEDARTHN